MYRPSHDLDVDAKANDCQTSSSNGGYLHEWVVYAKNARNRLHSNAKLTGLLGEMQSLNDSWDVVLFSEPRRSADVIILSGGHRLYSSHQQTSCAGVAVLVYVRHCAKIQKVATINERLMYIDVQTSKTIRFTAVYMPHAGYPEDDCNAYTISYIMFWTMPGQSLMEYLRGFQHAGPRRHSWWFVTASFTDVSVVCCWW